MNDNKTRCAVYESLSYNIGEPYCVDVPGNFEKRSNSGSDQFIRVLKNEARLVRELEEKEKAKTAENPRIRENLDTSHISIELQKHKLEGLVKERRRKFLHDNYEDLRNLKLQIFLAHAAKYQANTAAELERQRKQIFIDKKMETEKTRIKLLEEFEASKVDQTAEKQKKLEMICDLKEQMEYKEYVRHLLKLEKEEEHKESVRLKQIIKEEQLESIRKAQKNKLMTKQIIEDYLKQCIEFKMKSREESIIANEKAVKAQEDLDRRNEEMRQKKLQSQKAKQILSDKIGEELHKIKQEKLYQENRLFDLLIEEKAAKEDALEKKAAEDQAKLKKVFNLGYVDYQMSRQHAMLEKKYENELAMQERSRLQEEMKKEEENSRYKDKQKKNELRDQILYMMQEKEMTKLQNRKLEMERTEYIKKLESQRDAEIREERLNLLRAEPLDVLKYLPSKTLTAEEKKVLCL